MQTYGYIRVSTKEQNDARQWAAMSAQKIPRRNVYVDKKSGKDFERPAYRRMLNRVRPGDLIVVKSIDRLGRNYEEIIEQWKLLTRKYRADILIIDMPLLDTRRQKDLLGTFISDLVLQVLSFVSQTERDFIRQRQAEGIAAAKARGARLGRPKGEISDEVKRIVEEWQNKKRNACESAKLLRVSRRTFYNYVKKAQENFL